MTLLATFILKDVTQMRVAVTAKDFDTAAIYEQDYKQLMRISHPALKSFDIAVMTHQHL